MLKLVDYIKDGISFITDAETDLEAILNAVRGNRRVNSYGANQDIDKESINDYGNYMVEDIKGSTEYERLCNSYDIIRMASRSTRCGNVIAIRF